MPTRVTTRRILALIILAIALSAPVVQTSGTLEKKSSPGVRDPKPVVAAVARAAVFQLPLRFEQRSESAPNGTPFVARGAGYTVSVSAAGATLLLKGSSATTTRRLTMSVAGGRRNLPGLPRQALPGVSNYVIGTDPGQWLRGVRGYGEIEYHDVYPGVDVVYYGTQQELEYDFVVAPGSSPEPIALAYDGATGLRLDTHGNLVIATSDGDVVQHRPEIYQNIDGTRHAIRGEYGIRGDGSVGFRIGKYNHRLPLIIDPVLSYATYLGGANFERVAGVAIDNAGYVIVAGTTPSAEFPLGNPIQPQPRNAAIFVVKLSPAGDALAYATYVGGNGFETASALAVDDEGNAYVTGSVSSDFPATTRIGAGRATSDAFVVKLDPAGALGYATRIGGGAEDFANAIAVDSQGRASIVGNTVSADFPVVNPRQPRLGGNPALHSTDGTQTWSAADAGLNTAGVVAFAFDPSQPATVYAATLREGVFRTIDGGDTWTQTSLPAVQNIHALATQGDAVFALGEFGVYRTTDHGEHWTATSASLVFGTSLVATSASPSVLYAGQQSGGLLRSTDGGALWTPAGLPEQVQLLAAAGSTVYAATPFRIFRSTAAGAWIASKTTLLGTTTALAADTNDPQVAYLGTDRGLFKTVTGGADWFPIFDSGAPYIGAIAVCPSDPSTVFIFTSSGTAVSHDAGQSWSPMGLRRDVSLLTIAIDPRNSANVYAGTQVNSDAFLATLSPDGSSLESATFIGGRGSETGKGVAIDASGNTYVSGGTSSRDFPTSNAIQAARNEVVEFGFDAFVMKLSPQGVPVYSTYLGGSGAEFGGRIAADAAGQAYVTGNTRSPDFPVVNAAQPSPGGNGDMYVTAINASGSAFVYSTYLGGSGHENAQGSLDPSIAVTAAGEVTVTGATASNDFPATVDALRRTPGGGDDAFLTQFDAAGAIRYSTYLGRPGADYGQAVALDSAGTAIVAGYTNSTSWSTSGVVQGAFGGGDDAFVLKITPGTPPPDTIAPKTTLTGFAGTIGVAGWFTSPVTISVSGLDDPRGRGLAFFEYSLNGGVFQRYTGPVTLSAQGTTQFAARATDFAGNVESTPASATVMIDSVLPSARVAQTGTRGGDGWFTSPAAISISADDLGSGVASIEYRVNDGPFVLYKTPFSLSTQGDNTITTRTIDKAGNVSIAAPAPLRIDMSAPVTGIALSGTPGLAGWYSSPVTVSLSGGDNASGVGPDGIAYRINDGAFQPYTAPFVVAAQGTTQITARATDRAGNVESALPSSLFMIDSSAPTVTIASPQARDYLHSDTLVLSFSTTDNLSGVQSVAATLDNYYTLRDALPVPLRLLPLGAHRMDVSATDAAGNAVTQSVSFRIVATIDSLIESVTFYTDAGMINAASQKSLMAKLGDAKAARDRGNPSATAGKVRDFIDYCTAQSGRGIGTDTAVALIADAQYVLAAL